MGKKSRRPGRASRQAKAAERKASTTRIRVIVAAVVAALLITGGAVALLRHRAQREALKVTERVSFEVEGRGSFVMEVYPQAMPITAANFLALVKSGFYADLTWHRVEDWVVQTGDPTGTGSGGSEQTIPLETHPQLKNVRGAVGMARTDDPNSATSQFYILRRDARTLDGNYAIFGKVIEGMDVIDKLEEGDKISGAQVVSATPPPD